jgi:predicted transcriptional regulator
MKNDEPKQAHRPREETRRMIIEILRQRDTPLTRTEIARALQRGKTPHLSALVDDLVAEGTLQRAVRTFHNGVQGYVYFLGES